MMAQPTKSEAGFAWSPWRGFLNGALLARGLERAGQGGRRRGGGGDGAGLAAVLLPVVVRRADVRAPCRATGGGGVCGQRAYACRAQLIEFGGLGAQGAGGARRNEAQAVFAALLSARYHPRVREQ